MWGWLIVCYLLAGVNGAYVVTKWRIQADIRTLGSGNGGARNAGRVGGRAAFIWTVVIDALKTIIPLTIGVVYNFPTLVISGMVLALIIGHIWPITLKGSGGKGIVVYLACILVLEFTGLLIIGLAAILLKYLPISFSKGMLFAMVAPVLTTLIQKEMILSTAFAIGYAMVITAHLVRVHPRFKPKEGLQ